MISRACGKPGLCKKLPIGTMVLVLANPGEQAISIQAIEVLLYIVPITQQIRKQMTKVMSGRK